VPLLSEENRRKRNLVILAGFVLLVGTANLLDVGVYAPELPLASNIAVFALLNLNLIVLLLLVLLLLRNLVKLWFERREKVIGAKFKAKLVWRFSRSRSSLRRSSS
jgi:two-component system nitrogen regulation sensor histidine kinase NtrY